MRAFQTFQAFQSQPTRTTPVSRLTIVCLAEALNTLRKQMFTDLTALGLRATHVSITRWSDRDVASATVTLDCSQASRASLTALVMRLSGENSVRRVFWSDDANRPDRRAAVDRTDRSDRSANDPGSHPASHPSAGGMAGFAAPA